VVQTGQNGIYGRLDPNTGAIAVFDAPRCTGPYGVATTPDGPVFFPSLAGSYLGQINRETGAVTVPKPPLPRQGARRVWSDSRGGLWITGCNSGDLFRYDSRAKNWTRWHLPGNAPQPRPSMSTRPMRSGSATGARTQSCASIPKPRHSSLFRYQIPTPMRQLAGRKGEVWGAESGADKLFVLKAE
jgi:virginiamycin B lyase